MGAAKKAPKPKAKKKAPKATGKVRRKPSSAAPIARDPRKAHGAARRFGPKVVPPKPKPAKPPKPEKVDPNNAPPGQAIVYSPLAAPFSLMASGRLLTIHPKGYTAISSQAAGLVATKAHGLGIRILLSEHAAMLPAAIAAGFSTVKKYVAAQNALRVAEAHGAGKVKGP